MLNVELLEFDFESRFYYKIILKNIRYSIIEE